MSWQPDIDTALVAQRGRTSHERHRFIFKWRLHFMRRNVEMMNQLAGRERVWVDFSTDKPLRLGCVVKREQLGQQGSTCSSLPVGCSSGECGRAGLMCLFLQGNQIPVCGISLSRSTGVFSACFFVQVLMWLCHSVASYQKLPPIGVKTRQEHAAVFVASQYTLVHVSCKAETMLAEFWNILYLGCHRILQT